MTADLSDHRASSMVPSGTNDPSNASNDPIVSLSRNGPLQNVFLAQNATGQINGSFNMTYRDSGQQLTQQPTRNVFAAGASGSTEMQELPSVIGDMQTQNQQSEVTQMAQVADDNAVAPRSISDMVRVMPNGILFHIYLPFRLIVPLYNRLPLFFGFYGPK